MCVSRPSVPDAMRHGRDVLYHEPRCCSCAAHPTRSRARLARTTPLLRLHPARPHLTSTHTNTTARVVTCADHAIFPAQPPLSRDRVPIICGSPETVSGITLPHVG